MSAPRGPNVDQRRHGYLLKTKQIMSIKSSSSEGTVAAGGGGSAIAKNKIRFKGWTVVRRTGCGITGTLPKSADKKNNQ